MRYEWHSSRNDRTYNLLDTPLVNADGTTLKLGIFRDVTERKLAEQALQEVRQTRLHSTVTLFARLRGLSTSQPRATAMW